MQLQTISAKELRHNLPRIIKTLEKGASYTLIYRSRPVAQIKPISSSLEGLRLLLKAFPRFRFRSKKDSVKLVREIRD